MNTDPHTKEIEKRMGQIKKDLKRRGLKLTQQRLEIFNEVAGSGDHPCAETIYRVVRKRLPTVSLDTVYRTLWLFLDLGLIATLGPARERVRFDANITPHHHFVCRQCGTAYDFCSPELDRLEVPGEIEVFGQGEKINVEVQGLCRKCLKNGTES